MTDSSYRYTLQALLRKRCAELDVVKEELAGVNSRVAAHVQMLDTKAARLLQLENAQRDLSQGGAIIDVEARLRLHQCLRSALLEKEQQAAQLRQAQQQQDEVMDRVRGARQALKAIERHREQSVGQFKLEQQRKAHLAADELHLANQYGS